MAIRLFLASSRCLYKGTVERELGGVRSFERLKHLNAYYIFRPTLKG
jgi:hypothetical protein